MNDQELRLECLKLAAARVTNPAGVLETARRYYEFATSMSTAAPIVAKQEIVEMDWEGFKRKAIQDASAFTWVDRLGRPTAVPNCIPPIQTASSVALPSHGTCVSAVNTSDLIPHARCGTHGHRCGPLNAPKAYGHDVPASIF